MIVILNDQRKLSYELISSPDTPESAPTVLYFHGFPGSQAEGGMIAKQIVERKIRLISIARPGYGGSTFQAGRTFLDWPKDVLELVDQLKIKQFRVIGLSGGAPYVVACLHGLPRDRLIRAAIVSGSYPGCMSSKHTLLMNKLLATSSRRDWFPLGAVIEWYAGKKARNSSPKEFEAYFAQTVGSRHPMEAKCLEDPVVLNAAVESCRESFRQGGAAMAYETKLLSSDWHMSELTNSPLDVWYGGQDQNLPADRAVEVARSWGGKVHLFDEEAHVSLLINHADDILDHLLA